MPHASLTPLGRRLGAVLANLRPRCAPSPKRCGQVFDRHQRDSSSRITQLCSRTSYQERRYHVNGAIRSVAAAALEPAVDTGHTEYEPFPIQTLNITKTKTAPGLNRRRLPRKVQCKSITEALKASAHPNMPAAPPRRKLDLSHVNVRSRRGRSRYFQHLKKHRDDFTLSSYGAQEVTLRSTLARHIQYRENAIRTGDHERAAQFNLQPLEHDLLSANGYDIGDVRAWSEIVSFWDSLEASQALAKRIATHGEHSVPLFVLLYFLRRPYISATALSVVVRQSWKILAYHGSVDRVAHVPIDAKFLLFLRLLRHAREVLPTSLEDLSELLLQSLPRSGANGQQLTFGQLQTNTYLLNKAMRLLAVPTSIEPFKNNIYQEAGIVNILRYMVKHDPPLQINREGYRAVVVLQLAQRKRPNEQLWAELKTLSWPPWKEDRTAMDADITIEDYGTSKAAETLRRMREAGYGHRAWEKIASIYAGWDTDRTPTVQTLALLGNGRVLQFHTEAAKWTARITTTRTAQEAWACFLAYEDEKLPPNQEVYLAIFKKLHGEEMRKRNLRFTNRPEHADRRSIFPGDVREVESLPPSTHLYTYTRTPPPTMDELYRQLYARGVVFRGHCLAFLITHASRLGLGVQYLLNGATKYPSISQMVSVQNVENLNDIPMPIFTAFIELLTRFSSVRFPSWSGLDPGKQRVHILANYILTRRSFERSMGIL